MSIEGHYKPVSHEEYTTVNEYLCTSKLTDAIIFTCTFCEWSIFVETFSENSWRSWINIEKRAIVLVLFQL